MKPHYLAAWAGLVLVASIMPIADMIARTSGTNNDPPAFIPPPPPTTPQPTTCVICGLELSGGEIVIGPDGNGDGWGDIAHLDCTINPDAPNDPRLSGCEACGKTWNRVKSHTTEYGDGGCFPLCVDCWGERTPKERLPFYLSMWEKWHKERKASGGTYDITAWGIIEKAVLVEGTGPPAEEAASLQEHYLPDAKQPPTKEELAKAIMDHVEAQIEKDE